MATKSKNVSPSIIFSNDTIINVQGVSMLYSDVVALKDITFTVRKGEATLNTSASPEKNSNQCLNNKKSQ
ncbi:MAG: hypothetical protein ACTSXP_18590 [Promethearchaeota archaeon]